MKYVMCLCRLLIVAGLLSGCASPVPKSLQYYTKSVTVAQTTQAQIYSRSRTWIAMNKDRYHFELNFANAKTGTIVFTGRAYSRSCHNVMNDCPFLSYNVYQKIVDNHFTLTFSDYRFYLNIQDPGQAANLRQFQQLELLLRTIARDMRQAVLLTSKPMRAALSDASQAAAQYLQEVSTKVVK